MRDSSMTATTPVELTWSADNQPTIQCGDKQVATFGELLKAAPHLKKKEQLNQLCQALNHLWRGNEYALIDDPDAYRDRYQQRLAAEDPHATWRPDAVRLRDFGVCDLSELAAPRVKGKQLIFYVEDDYLGVPYRVTAPTPTQPKGDPTYEPLPVVDA
jgi:hypothetical protein